MNKPTKLQRFFFLTYAAFLLPSIPHIASYFLAFEGNVQGYELWFWVVVSYLIAIAIDGTLLWLTHTVARDTTHKWGYRAIIWLFIFFLVVFSGFLNWHIAKHNAPLASQQLSGAFIPDVDPVVASLFPFLAIMYAVMSRHVFADVKTDEPKNIEELEAEANIAERRANALARINAAKDQEKTSWIKGKIGIAQNVFSTPNSSPIEDKSPENSEPNSGELESEFVANLPDISSKVQKDLTSKLEPNSGEIPIVIPGNSEPTLRGKYYMTFEEASEYTGYKITYLKGKVTSGTLKTSPNGDKLLVSSLAGMKNKTKSNGHNGHNTTLDNLELLNIQG